MKRCATAYGKYYVYKSSSDLSLHYRRNTKSPAVTGVVCQELGEVQISLHKIIHVDWFRFCALRYDDEAREMLAEIANNCGSEEETQPGKRLEP